MNVNIMDMWVIAANQNLIKYVRNEMDNYRLYNVVKHMLQFLDELTNWYVRLNRSRMKGEEGV
jgi:isoleucyl-tRNA synthetase